MLRGKERTAFFFSAQLERISVGGTACIEELISPPSVGIHIFRNSIFFGSGKREQVSGQGFARTGDLEWSKA